MTESLHQLVDRCAPRLYRVAARIIGNAADAEDVLQDVFLRAHRSLRAGSVVNEAVLVKAVTRLSLNALRGRGRAAAREQAAAPSGVDAGAADARIALRELGELLAGLSPEQRAALVLKELEGLTAKETADALGCSEGAVEQRLVRAREFLRARSAA